jgi:RecG-like helicase
MTNANAKKLADFQQITVHGRITYMEVVDYQQQQFLSVVLAHTVSENTDVRVKFTNSNGLLTAYGNGNLVVGQELTVSGSIKGIRSFYMKEDELVPLKYPELQLRCTGYIFGSKPQVKSEVAVEPTLEEIPF